LNNNRKFFGTDGIRGRANSFPITAEIALKVGMATGARFGSQFTKNNHRHRVVIGKDTRLSGYMIESALTAGLVAVGLDVFLLGPMPTPAVAMLTRSMRADVGFMISASHNPHYDNGIKIFNGDGSKLGDEIEKEIEELLESDLTKFLAKPEELGRVKRIDDAAGRYVEFVKNSFPSEQNLEQLKIVVDCANGASYRIAPLILRELGAKVFEIGVEPNGFNINDNCGSTKPKLLQNKVLEVKADIGICLDGDADRLLVVDEMGNVVDGDILIALIAEKLHDEGRLKGDLVAITQMSNMALEEYLAYIGVSTIRTQIGDRYVLEAMRENNCNFGGEQSGHLILSDYSTTGDGIISSLQILSLLAKNSKKMSELAKIFLLNPQILKNISFANQAKAGSSESKNPLKNQEVLNFIAEKQNALEKEGRVMVRKSGTENLIRIMVEGKNHQQIAKIAEEIAEKIQTI